MVDYRMNYRRLPPIFRDILLKSSEVSILCKFKSSECLKATCHLPRSEKAIFELSEIMCHEGFDPVLQC